MTKLRDNGFNPVFNEEFELYIRVPEIAVLKITVNNGPADYIAHSFWPVKCLRTGIRSLPLKNDQDEVIKGSSLLCAFDIEFINNK